MRTNKSNPCKRVESGITARPAAVLNKITCSSWILALTLVALAAGNSAFGSGRVEPSPELTKQQVKVLITTAKTPEDHLNLARYYRSEAARLTDEAKDHQEMEAAYKENPGSHIIPKWPTMGAHCENMVSNYTRAAKEASEMADMHEEMSKLATQ